VAELTPEELVDLLRMMLRIRRFEDGMIQLFREKTIAGENLGALHSCNGQEATAVGVCRRLRRDDYVFSTHRGHGHALAKGADLKRVVAELLGRQTGLCRGWGGSMHLFDPQIGLMGGNGIVGGGLPLALGTGYSAQYRGTDQITVCFFGDGAASQGSFHESLNQAALLALPIVYVCENNLYAATTHVRKNCPIENIADRAGGYGIPGRVVDGNDVLAVQEAARQAVERARTGDGPTLLECKTYRHWPHCMVIPEHRKRGEVEEWKTRDPILLFTRKLLAEGLIHQDRLDQLEADVKTELAEAVAYAKQSPVVNPQQLPAEFWVEENQGATL
jgi:TPP-dependent pyruvate/acetoin dehydrogenase alpha subunit